MDEYKDFLMPGRDLAPGWRWMLWGIGAGIAGIPFVLRVVRMGWPSYDEALPAVLLGVPWLMFYLLFIYVYSRWRVGIVFVLFLLALFSGLSLCQLGGSQRPSWMFCISNLKQIGLALRIYEEREGCYPEATGPAFLAELYQTGDCPDLHWFLCCGSGRKVATIFATDFVGNPAAAGMKDGNEPANPSAFPLVWESQPFHFGGTKRCVLFMDGSVLLVKESDFQVMLAKGGK